MNRRTKRSGFAAAIGVLPPVSGLEANHLRRVIRLLSRRPDTIGKRMAIGLLFADR